VPQFAGLGIFGASDLEKRITDGIPDFQAVRAVRDA